MGNFLNACKSQLSTPQNEQTSTSEFNKHNDDYNYLIKIVLAGDKMVGKSQFAQRISGKSFSEQYKRTIGVEFCSKIFNEKELDGVKLQLWDMDSRLSNTSSIPLNQQYYKGAIAVLLLYDVTNRESYDSIDNWITEIKKYSNPNVQIYLIGNKIDLPRIVELNDGTQKAEQHGIRYFEVSCKESDICQAMADILRDSKKSWIF